MSKECKKYTSVGGQAIIEGVMMRGLRIWLLQLEKLMEKLL